MWMCREDVILGLREPCSSEMSSKHGIKLVHDFYIIIANIFSFFTSHRLIKIFMR